MLVYLILHHSVVAPSFVFEYCSEPANLQYAEKIIISEFCYDNIDNKITQFRLD